MEKKLARITRASLEIQERGIFTFWIHVDYEEGKSQGVGGICLDAYNKEQERRVGTAYGCEIIRRILLEFNVNDFKELAGKNCWVYGDGPGLSFITKGISSLNCNNKKSYPIIWEDILKEFK